MVQHENEQPRSPRRIVLLGAGGFIGRSLAALFDLRSIPYLGLGVRDIDLSANRAGARLAKLLHPDDSVVFLSALTPDKGRGIEPFVKNIAIGAAVCEAMAKIAPSHVTYFSSDAVYPLTNGLISERSCAQPPDLYGMMHLAREEMVRSTVRAPVLILRSTLIFGAADTHNSYGPNRLRRTAYQESKIVLFGEGEERRDHLYVKDAAELVLRALELRTAGTLNLATGRSVSYAELAKVVATSFGRNIPIMITPRQKPITHRYFDVTALRKAFPDFAFTSLDAAIVESHREMLMTEAR